VEVQQHAQQPSSDWDVLRRGGVRRQARAVVIFLLVEHDARDGFEPGDLRQQARADFGHALDHFLLFVGERLAGAQAPDNFAWHGDEADLRQHRPHLQFPAIGDSMRFGVGAHAVAQGGTEAERLRVLQGQDFGHDPDAAGQGLLQELAFGGDEQVLLGRVFHRQPQHFRGTGFAEELVDVAFVDGIDRGLLVTIAGQHDAHRIRNQFLGHAEELDAVHDRHTHVRHHNGKRPAGFQRGQAQLPVGGDADLEAASEVPLVSVEDVGVVVDK